MSMFSVTALDTLIDTTGKGASSLYATDENESSREKRPLYTYSPSAINSNRPRSPSPSSFSSSPFIVNFKGRRPLHWDTHNSSPLQNDVQSETSLRKDVMDQDSIPRLPAIISPPTVERRIWQTGEEMVHGDGIDADNTEPGSFREANFSTTGKCQPSKYSLEVVKTEEGSEDEYFDVCEWPASDGSSYQSLSSMECSSSSISNLLVELEADVDKSTSTEKAFFSLKHQREAVLEKLFFDQGSAVASHTQVVGGSALDLLVFSNELKQRIEVAKLVACAVAKGAAKAETEDELGKVIDCKNREISRLQDKLHYYEILNHEMSQRNQECVALTSFQCS